MNFLVCGLRSIIFFSMIVCADSFAANPELFFFAQQTKRPRGSDCSTIPTQSNKIVSEKKIESKFSDKEALVHVCRQLRQLCLDSTGDDSVTYQALIDKAREVVRADDEYKAKAHILTALFFGHPSIKKGFLIVSSFTLGYGFGWLSFGQ